MDALLISLPKGDQVFTLKGAEHPYRVLLETMDEGAAFLVTDGVIAYCNRKLSDMLQIPMEKLLGSPLAAYLASQDQALVADRLVDPPRQGGWDEITLKSAAGNTLPVLFSCRTVELAGKSGTGVLFTDISTRKQAERQILRLNRLYAMSSAMNNTIAHDHDRDTLFHEFCRIAVELGGFRLAWVGLSDPETGLVKVTAAAGETGFLDGIRVTVNDVLEGRWPTGIAIRAGSHSICNDFLHTEGTRIWHEKARVYGLLASASVAFKENGVVIGAFTLYAGELDYFNEQQIELLQQMGADISFAIDHLILASRLREAERQAHIAAERERNESALRDSEERLRLALDAAHLGTYDWDPSCDWAIWSRRMEQIFGFRPGEFAGRYEDFAGRVHPEDLPKVEAEIVRSRTERNRYACEYRVVWPDGSVHWVFALGEFNFDADGQALHMRGTAEDITERKRMALALYELEAQQAASRYAQSEQKFRTLTEAMPQIVWMTRPDGWNIYFNQQWVDYTGLTLEESHGHGWNIPFHPNDKKRAWDAWQLATQTDGDYSLECRLRRADGIYRWWLIRGVSLHDADGKVVNWFGTCTDIQDMKEYEEKRINAEEALQRLNATLERRVQEETEKNRLKDHLLIQQSRLAAMGEMIGNIAHQWRQPLNALGLVLANLVDAASYQELTPEYLDSQIRTGERLIQSMSGTIDDFRHFFRPRKRPEPFSAATAINEALSLMSASFANNNIKLRLDVAEDVQIAGFANEFSQVLLNLLSNAKDAILAQHKADGLVTIRLSRDKSCANVVVADNGGGIPEDIMERIFDPYFTTREKGTGIGLYMSKMIVESSMCGSISANNMGSGVEVTIICPLPIPGQANERPVQGRRG